MNRYDNSPRNYTEHLQQLAAHGRDRLNNVARYIERHSFEPRIVVGAVEFDIPGVNINTGEEITETARVTNMEEARRALGY